MVGLDEEVITFGTVTKAHPPGSPVSVASALSASPISVASTFETMPEIKPIVLPGAWVTVGKGGKPLKNTKMYDDPTKASKKKKRRRVRKQQPADTEPADLALLVALEGAPSTSKSVERHERASTRREKMLARADDAKHWARYRKAKDAKAVAHDALVAALGYGPDGPDDLADDEIGENDEPAVPKPRSPRKLVEKVRRRARRDAAAARCYSQDALEDVPFESDAKTAATSSPDQAKNAEGKAQSKQAKQSKQAPAVLGGDGLLPSELSTVEQLRSANRRLGLSVDRPEDFMGLMKRPRGRSARNNNSEAPKGTSSWSWSSSEAVKAQKKDKQQCSLM